MKHSCSEAYLRSAAYMTENSSVKARIRVLSCLTLSAQFVGNSGQVVMHAVCVEAWNFFQMSASCAEHLDPGNQPFHHEPQVSHELQPEHLRS